MSKTISILIVAIVVASLPVIIGLGRPASDTTVAQTASGSLSSANFKIAAPLTVVSGGTWSASKGVYSITNPKVVSVGNGNIAIHSTSVPAQFEIDTDANVVSTPGQNSFSILFGYKDVSNYYGIKFSESNSAGGIFKVVQGQTIQIGNVSKTISAGATYKVKIIRDVASLNVYLNDELVSSMNTSSDFSGQMGYATESDSAFFDNLKVIGY